MSRVPVVAVGLIVVSALAGGCNKSTSTANNDNGAIDSEAGISGSATNPADDIESVKSVPPEGKGLQSPAKQESRKRFDPDLDPSSVTSQYLKSLKDSLTDAENLKTANELLTSKARNATNLANVDVSLPGTGQANYVVHQAEYVTNEKNVAHVRTSWNDEIENQKYQYDVTWVLKNEPAVGWRVAGMITASEDTQETVVFNFEDAADIASKGASEPVGPEGQELRTAEKKQESTIR